MLRQHLQTSIVVLSWLAAILFFTPCVWAVPQDHSQHTNTPPTTKPPIEQKLTLADLESLALQRNPTLTQAAALIEASKGKAVQAGLYPNPTIGMEAEQINANRTAGEVRWFVLQQEIVTAGKLRLSRAKYQQETYQAEIQAMAQQVRVVNSIQIAYYDVLASQRLIDLHRELLKNAQEAVKTTEQMLNVGQANEPDLLQARVEADREKVAFGNAEKRYRRDWDHLFTLVGAPEMQPTPLAGSLETQTIPLEGDAELCRLLQESPEMLIARAEVVRDEITLQREKVEAFPNITLQGATGYNYETRNTTADVSFRIRLPVFDRNQGTIRQANGELMRAHAEISRVELDLRRRYADAFYRYRSAWDSAQDFQKSSLPNAKRAFDLYQEYRGKGRATWPQVLVAERTYTQLSEEYLHALLSLRRAEVEIKGFLLVDGLAQPSGSRPQGHIEASPKPR